MRRKLVCTIACFGVLALAVATPRPVLAQQQESRLNPAEDSIAPAATAEVVEAASLPSAKELMSQSAVIPCK